MILADANTFMTETEVFELLVGVGHFAAYDETVLRGAVERAFAQAYTRQSSYRANYYEISDEVRHLVRSGKATKSAPLHGVMHNIVMDGAQTCFMCWKLHKNYAWVGCQSGLLNAFKFSLSIKDYEERDRNYLTCFCDDCYSDMFWTKSGFDRHKYATCEISPVDEVTFGAACALANKPKFRRRLADRKHEPKLRFRPDVLVEAA